MSITAAMGLAGSYAVRWTVEAVSVIRKDGFRDGQYSFLRARDGLRLDDEPRRTRRMPVDRREPDFLGFAGVLCGVDLARWPFDSKFFYSSWRCSTSLSSDIQGYSRRESGSAIRRWVMTRLLEEFVEGGIEPFPDNAYGPGYRCSAELLDGTFLPCVMIRRRKFIVELAERRLAEEKGGAGIFRSSTDPHREMHTRGG